VLNHPGYSDILIDHDALSQLPEDDSVVDRVMTANTERETDPLTLTRRTSPEHVQADNTELVETQPQYASKISPERPTAPNLLTLTAKKVLHRSLKFLLFLI
jgi:hypothetical protein